MQFLHVANSDKPVTFYNLDVILSVGYRVNSKQATYFRRWANSVLKDYLLKGYAINQNMVDVTQKF
ncbi:MAG: RhuM family protein [Neisseriaceae bacterium]